MAPPAIPENPFVDPATGVGPTFGPGFRQVPPPDVFEIAFSSDKKSLIFTVGDPADSPRRRPKASYRVYFAPINAATPTQMGDFQIAYNVFHGKSGLIASADAPQNGGLVTMTDTVHAGLDGWFFATAMNQLGIESDFKGPIRNPLIGTNDTRVPPDVFNQAVTLFDGGLDPAGRQIVRARCSAKVPSQSKGVGSVQLVNTAKGYGGTGYTHDFFVNFLGGGGSGAMAVAHVSGGSVVNVEVTAAGENYTSPPTVDFSNGDGIGAAAFAFLTTSGSMSGIQIYLQNYFQAGIAVEAAEIKNVAPLPGDTIAGDLILIADAPPDHDVRFYFVALSQTGTRRADPLSAPFVDFLTGVHL